MFVDIYLIDKEITANKEMCKLAKLIYRQGKASHRMIYYAGKLQCRRQSSNKDLLHISNFFLSSQSSLSAEYASFIGAISENLLLLLKVLKVDIICIKWY